MEITKKKLAHIIYVAGFSLKCFQTKQVNILHTFVFNDELGFDLTCSFQISFHQNLETIAYKNYAQIHTSKLY